MARAAAKGVNHFAPAFISGVSPLSRRNSAVAAASFEALRSNRHCAHCAVSFGQGSHYARDRVSADFCVKLGSEFCARMAKDRIRDNASLSASNDAGADHGWRGSRIRRFAKGLTSIKSAGRTGARLRTSRGKGVFREDPAGRGRPNAQEQFWLARPGKRMRRLSPSCGCGVCRANLPIGRKS